MKHQFLDQLLMIGIVFAAWGVSVAFHKLTDPKPKLQRTITVCCFGYILGVATWLLFAG